MNLRQQTLSSRMRQKMIHLFLLLYQRATKVLKKKVQMKVQTLTKILKIKILMLSHFFQNQMRCHKLTKRKKRKKSQDLENHQEDQSRSPSESLQSPRRDLLDLQRNPRKLWSLSSPTLANKSLEYLLLKLVRRDQLGSLGLRGILVIPATSLAKLSAILTIACSKMTQLERSLTRKSKDRNNRECEPYLRKLKTELALCRQKRESLKPHVTLLGSIALKLALK